MSAESEKYQRQQRVFLEAVELTSPEGREAYLVEACGQDDALRSDVEALLKAADEVIETPNQDENLDEGQSSLPLDENVGALIGRYKILQLIGEGAFGSVYLAGQSEPVKRRVALKIIKEGMDTRQVIARFEAERQALAMMDHPNIARVLDAGATGRGRPYFVMELVKGIPITHYCDKAGLGIDDRLALFGDVCAAISHAHQKGIIHRDIKPSNVMVALYADHPVVKVIDFGIAKATQGKLTDKTFFTRYEQFIGTPVYMSPEQAEHSVVDIDTRSDIYALGVLLYELLAGKPPFDPKTLLCSGYDEMRRIIREDEPPTPSSRLGTAVDEERTAIAKIHHIEPDKLNRLVEPDLDWIVMKAIEKDRTRRYETANAFAADIARFLSDEPVLAAAPSAAYKFRKFARRNRVAFGVAGLTALLLVGGILVSTWQAVRASRAENVAERNLIEAQAARERSDLDRADAVAAQKKERTAREEAEAIAAFLGKIFRSPNPYLGDQRSDGRSITVADTLAAAAKNLRTDLADQPERRAKLQITIADTYDALGLPSEAIPLYLEALEFRKQKFGSEHASLLPLQRLLAHCYQGAGRTEEALKMCVEVVASSLKVDGPANKTTHHWMEVLARTYKAAGRSDKEQEVMGKLIALCEDLLTQRRKDLGPEHRDTCDVRLRLGIAYHYVGRKEEALALHEESLAVKSKLLGPEHRSTVMAKWYVANSYAVAGRKEEATSMREEILAAYRKSFGPEHPNTLRSMHGLAKSYHSIGRKEEAIRMVEEMVATGRRVFDPTNISLRSAKQSLANFYQAEGRMEAARKLIEELQAPE